MARRDECRKRVRESMKSDEVDKDRVEGYFVRTNERLADHVASPFGSRSIRKKEGGGGTRKQGVRTRGGFRSPGRSQEKAAREEQAGARQTQQRARFRDHAPKSPTRRCKGCPRKLWTWKLGKTKIRGKVQCIVGASCGIESAMGENDSQS
jgi:hypothetical protein